MHYLIDFTSGQTCSELSKVVICPESQTMYVLSASIDLFTLSYPTIQVLAPYVMYLSICMASYYQRLVYVYKQHTFRWNIFETNEKKCKNISPYMNSVRYIFYIIIHCDNIYYTFFYSDNYIYNYTFCKYMYYICYYANTVLPGSGDK